MSLILNNFNRKEATLNAPLNTTVQVATTVAVDLSTDVNSGDIIDGVTLSTGNRILIKNQTNGVENGIYNVQTSGTPTRTSLATDDHAAATAITVSSGTANENTIWVCTNNYDSDVVDNDELVFVKVPSDSLQIFSSNASGTTNVLLSPEHGVLFYTPVCIDSIDELTSNNGVSIEGVTLKDSTVSISGNQVVSSRGSAVTDATITANSLTDSTGGTASSTIDAAPIVYAAADIDNIHASLTTTINDMVTDVNNLKTQLNALLTRLRNHGLIET